MEKPQFYCICAFLLLDYINGKFHFRSSLPDPDQHRWDWAIFETSDGSLHILVYSQNVPYLNHMHGIQIETFHLILHWPERKAIIQKIIKIIFFHFDIQNCLSLTWNLLSERGLNIISLIWVWFYVAFSRLARFSNLPWTRIHICILKSKLSKILTPDIIGTNLYNRKEQ